MIRIVSIVGGIVISSTVSFVCMAQEQAACIGILDRVNYNYMRSSSSAQQYALNKANFCSADYQKASSAQKANIGAAYTMIFSGTASGASDQISEKQKTECNSQLGETWYERGNLSEQRVAVVEALDTVAKCIALSQSKNLHIRTTISQDNKQIDVGLTWKEGASLKVNYAGPPSFNALSCFRGGVPVAKASDLSGMISPGGGEWTFTCIRIPTEVVSNQGKFNCYEPINIVIDTERAVESIPLPRACDADFLLSREKLVDEKIKKLTDELNVANSSIAELRRRVDNIKITITDKNIFMDYPNGKFWNGDQPSYANYTCPDKNVLVGMEFGYLARDERRFPWSVKYICRELGL